MDTHAHTCTQHRGPSRKPSLFLRLRTEVEAEGHRDIAREREREIGESGEGGGSLFHLSPNGPSGQICPLRGSSHAKIDTTPNKASPDTPIGIADAPPPGLSRMPRTAVWGAVVEKCPPPRRRSPASGGAAPRPAEPWRRRHVLYDPLRYTPRMDPGAPRTGGKLGKQLTFPGGDPLGSLGSE